MSKFDQGMFTESALDDKIVWITGGGSGLGKSMASYFLSIGAKVIISGRSIDKLENAAKEMNSDRLFFYGCDVREYTEVENVFKLIVEEVGVPNVLVNNAAGNFISPTERLSHRAFDIIIDIVLKGTKNCTLTCGKYWIENRIKGTVLNIVTTYSWTGSAFVVPSATAKAGVLALTRSLAVEWGRYGIRNNAIAPGPFPTKGAWDRLFPKEISDKLDLKKRIPLNRLGNHQELANLAAFLVSDYSSYINGEVITIDGGEWLQGAGQFNDFLKFTPGEWEILEKIVRSNQKTS